VATGVGLGEVTVFFAPGVGSILHGEIFPASAAALRMRRRAPGGCAIVAGRWQRSRRYGGNFELAPSGALQRSWTGTAAGNKERRFTFQLDDYIGSWSCRPCIKSRA
jgi:hypothetical protein